MAGFRGLDAMRRNTGAKWGGEGSGEVYVRQRHGWSKSSKKASSIAAVKVVMHAEWVPRQGRRTQRLQ